MIVTSAQTAANGSVRSAPAGTVLAPAPRPPESGGGGGGGVGVVRRAGSEGPRRGAADTEPPSHGAAGGPQPRLHPHPPPRVFSPPQRPGPPGRARRSLSLTAPGLSSRRREPAPPHRPQPPLHTHTPPPPGRVGPRRHPPAGGQVTVGAAGVGLRGARKAIPAFSEGNR